MRKRLRVLVVLVNIAISMNFCIFEVKGETNENVQKESDIFTTPNKFKRN